MNIDFRQETPSFPECLVPRIWVELCERMQEPVRVTAERKGIRIVEVLGVLRYYVLHTARRVHFAYAVGNGRFVTGRMREFVNVDPVLAGDMWLAYFAANCFVTRGTQVRPEDFPDFAARIRKTRAFRLLRDRVRSCRIEGPLRDRIAEALALEPRIIAWACQGLPRGELATINSRQYSAIWRRREAFEQLERENPALLRPYAAAVLGEVLGDHPEPARDLKLAFRVFGIGDAGWKLLVDAPPGHFDPVITNACNDDLFEVYLWALHACLGAGVLLPKRVLHRLVMPNGREPGRPVTLDPSFPEGYWTPFLRALGRRIASVNGAVAMRAFLDGEFEDVYDWLEWERPAIDANQARAGWAWMVRQHQAWQEREREVALAIRDEYQWPVPVPAFEHGGYRVVALADSYELWEEGRAMRHCVRTYARRCMKGRDIVVSIRDSVGRRAATAHIVRNSCGWAVESVRLYANRLAGREMWDIAWAYARTFNAALSGAKKPSLLAA